MSFRRAINLFPWDVQSEGAAPCLGAIAALGCSTVVLSANYHRARLFRPRALGYYNRPVDWCDFTPTPSLYEEPALLPPVNPDPRCLAATQEAELSVVPAFTGAPEQLWRIEQLPDGTWRIMPKAVPNSKEVPALSALGGSFATLSKFDPKSDKQRWVFKTP